MSGRLKVPIQTFARSIPISRKPLTDPFVIVNVLVDDWYQQIGKQYLQGKLGAKPEFTDSDAVILVLMQDIIKYPSETQYFCYIHANYLALFPKIVNQSQLNRWNLLLLTKKLRPNRIQRKTLNDQHCFPLDIKPVPVLSYKRSKQQSEFLGSDDYGHFASRHINYFGNKLVTINILFGIPIFYDLVPPNNDERQTSESVTDNFTLRDIFADKGFIGLDWQIKIFDKTGTLIWTPRPDSQQIQNSAPFNRLLLSDRERIEGVFHEIQDVSCNIEQLTAKTIVGLITRVIAKMTSLFYDACYLLISVLMCRSFRCLPMLRYILYET